MFDVIIVGSGPAAAAAALELKGTNICVLDIGYRGKTRSTPNDSPYQIKESSEDTSALLLGEKFESLHNISKSYLSPKLKSPAMSFVTQSLGKHYPHHENVFDMQLSCAKGGLANAWGAGLFRYSEKDLTDFPIKKEDLDLFYDKLTEHIGISGQEDDLSPFFGSTHSLQAPLRLNYEGASFLKSYQSKKKKINKMGVYIGHPRLGVLTEDKDGRPAYDYRGMEFFEANKGSIYNPCHTIEQLEKSGDLQYFPNKEVLLYEERENETRVLCNNLKSGEVEEFFTKRLILAAGAVGTAKIVLNSKSAFSRKLPLLDNKISYIPLFSPFNVGRGQEERIFSGAQLSVVYRGELSPCDLQASFYGLSGTLRSDFLMNFPFSMRANMAASKYSSPAMTVIQLFYPDRPRNENYLQLKEDRSIELRYQTRDEADLESVFAKAANHLGCFTHSSLWQFPNPGNSFHYAGMLPMSKEPKTEFECGLDGKLNKSKSVYVADAASFPVLPSKNHSFTIMANSMRIAHGLRAGLS